METTNPIQNVKVFHDVAVSPARAADSQGAALTNLLFNMGAQMARELGERDAIERAEWLAFVEQDKARSRADCLWSDYQDRSDKAETEEDET